MNLLAATLVIVLASAFNHSEAQSLRSLATSDEEGNDADATADHHAHKSHDLVRPKLQQEMKEETEKVTEEEKLLENEEADLEKELVLLRELEAEKENDEQD